MGIIVQIQNIKILNFRGLKDLAVEGFGRINLVTGAQGCGKTSLLQAIEVLASGSSPATLCKIAGVRPPILTKNGEIDRADETWLEERLERMSGLFYGYPKWSAPEKDSPGFAIEAEDSGFESVRVRPAWKHEELQQLADSALAITKGGRRHVVEIAYADRRGFGSPSAVEFIPSVGLPYREQQRLWDEVALTDAGDATLDMVRTFHPQISRIAFVSKGRDVVPYCRHEKFGVGTPLQDFGDGAIKTFNIALALVNAKNGIFLVDGIESGLHYDTLPEVWRKVLGLAEKWDVQVFATTHSDECRRIFKETLAAEGQVIDLA